MKNCTTTVREWIIANDGNFCIFDILPSTTGSFSRQEVSCALFNLRKWGSIELVKSITLEKKLVSLYRKTDKIRAISKHSGLKDADAADLDVVLKPWAEVWPDFFNVAPIVRGRVYSLEM